MSDFFASHHLAAVNISLNVNEQIGSPLFCSDFRSFRLSCSWQASKNAPSYSWQKGLPALAVC